MRSGGTTKGIIQHRTQSSSDPKNPIAEAKFLFCQDKQEEAVAHLIDLIETGLPVVLQVTELNLKDLDEVGTFLALAQITED